MCWFLSAIATRDGRLLFTELDSHEEIIRRAGLRDTNRHLSHFVRLEQRPGETALRVDREATTPSWFEPMPWQERMDALLRRLAPAKKAYEEACATALKPYVEACATIEGYLPL